MYIRSALLARRLSGGRQKDGTEMDGSYERTGGMKYATEAALRELMAPEGLAKLIAEREFSL